MDLVCSGNHPLTPASGGQATTTDSLTLGDLPDPRRRGSSGRPSDQPDRFDPDRCQRGASASRLTQQQLKEP